MKAASRFTMQLSDLSQPFSLSSNRLRHLLHTLQRVGQYSLAIALGSAVSQSIWPTIARSMPVDDSPSTALDSQTKPLFQEEGELPTESASTDQVPADSNIKHPSSSKDTVVLEIGMPSQTPRAIDESSVASVSDAPAATPEIANDSALDSNSEQWFANALSPDRVDAPALENDPVPQPETFLSPQSKHQLDQLFVGGTESLVAKAVGSAEGTRTPAGEKTWAYYGHTDPGNGVYNLGTFSYQHEASSPEDADQRQLQRLRNQAQQIQEDAESRGMTLGIEEQLNAIDLANQAPKAALSYGGYLDRLEEAYNMGLRGDEAILWARVRSYIDPNTQRWNAPGLGNDSAKIEADQRRRMDMIARAMLAAHQTPSISSYSSNQQPVPSSESRSPAPAPSARPLSPILEFGIS